MPLTTFPLGELVATPGALRVLAESSQTAACFLARHARGDWGCMVEEDWRLNDEALILGDRILSAYQTERGVKLWIITEADRSSTTILLPEDY